MGKLSEFDGAAPEEVVKSCAECNRRVEHPTNAQLSFCGMDEARRVVGAYKESVPDWCYFVSKRPPMTDITAPKMVEVQIRHDQKVIWVNVDGMCALRCCQVGHLVLPDDEECDGTDAAHPAWWRGHGTGVLGTIARIQQILDGKDDGAGVFASPELEKLRRDLIALKASEQHLIEKEAGENL